MTPPSTPLSYLSGAALERAVARDRGDKADLDKFVADFQEQWFLRDWDIRVAVVRFRKSLEHEANGDTICDTRWRVAQIRISDRVPPESRLFILAHELAHVLLSDMRETIKSMIARLPKGAGPLAADLLTEEEERLCHRFSHALASSSPAPVSHGDKKGKSYPSWATQQ